MFVSFYKSIEPLHMQLLSQIRVFTIRNLLVKPQHIAGAANGNVDQSFRRPNLQYPTKQEQSCHISGHFTYVINTLSLEGLQRALVWQ